ncbi:hypothetical protein CEXT_757161 [Caerostris extrusa]|uniref:Uncharacterized protein n=1 Tax=Caerostris extrusa TaxID=172846 RepID=A0AAV4V7R1_CAEEX|nr:hypothetical protein CEXT_757161 [Caerostris extrusa]
MFNLDLIHVDLSPTCSSSLFINHICFTVPKLYNTLSNHLQHRLDVQTSLKKPQVSLKQDRPDAPDSSSTQLAQTCSTCA